MGERKKEGHLNSVRPTTSDRGSFRLESKFPLFRVFFRYRMKRYCRWEPHIPSHVFTVYYYLLLWSDTSRPKRRIDWTKKKRVHPFYSIFWTHHAFRTTIKTNNMPAAPRKRSTAPSMRGTSLLKKYWCVCVSKETSERGSLSLPSLWRPKKIREKEQDIVHSTDASVRCSPLTHMISTIFFGFEANVASQHMRLFETIFENPVSLPLLPFLSRTLCWIR